MTAIITLSFYGIFHIKYFFKFLPLFTTIWRQCR